MEYIPKPFDTKEVHIQEDILALSELLAKNSHEVWAKERISQGWSYGPVRDDARKQHPCLISYEELPESEKVYDRNTAIETLKLILALGYEIKKQQKVYKY